jgi:hypothetical protein
MRCAGRRGRDDDVALFEHYCAAKAANACNAREEFMKLPVIVGWAIELMGTALWVYGYFVTGHPSLIDWHDITPSWFAEWLPNIEAEIGLALVLVGMVPIYWPSRQQREIAIPTPRMSTSDPPTNQSIPNHHRRSAIK